MKYYRLVNKIRVGLKHVLTINKGALINYLRYRLSPLKTSKVLGFTPVQATLLTTARCNLNCSWCSFSSIVKSDKWQDLELTVDDVKKVLEHPLIKNTLSFLLTGGEPLTNKNIIPIISLLKKRGRITGMITNGILIKDHLDELKSAGLDRVFISVYPNTVDILKKNLPAVTKQFKNVMLSKIILKSELINRDSILEDAIKLAIETGCSGIQFMQLEALGAGANIKEELIFSDCKEFYEFKEYIIKKYPNLNCRWQDPYPVAGEEKTRHCRRPWWEMIVNAKGDATFCCPVFGVNTLAKGFNIFKNDDMRNAPFWIDMRERLLDESLDCHALCEFCNLLYDKDISRL